MGNGRDVHAFDLIVAESCIDVNMSKDVVSMLIVRHRTV